MQLCKLELLLIFRNRAFLVFSTLILIAAFFAVHQGKVRLQNEAADFADLTESAENAFKKWQAQAAAQDFDLGSMGYYYFEATQHPAEPLAALFNGQRIMDTLSHNIRLLAITGQIYGQEKQNPDLQLQGFLDLGFIFIYIIPLLIGVMTCRLWASEKESGRLLLLKSVIHSEKSLINFRLLLIFILIAIFQLLLLVYGFFAVCLSLNLQFFSIYLALILYQTLWFVLSWIINRSGFQSIKATLTYVTVWIFLTLVIPGTAINYSQYRYPATQGINMMLEQRQHMHNAWDRDKQADLNEFYHAFPQYADSKPLPEDFHWKWYFAMQLMSDRKVDSTKQDFRTQIQNRIDMVKGFSFLSPSIALQGYLTQQAKTDMQSQMDYLQAIETYHQSLFDYFAQHLFYDKQPDPNLSNFPKFEFNYEN
jgi:ABC-2 type transport system permease protein